MGGSKSSSQQPLYQRPPLNGSANFNSQDRFAGANGSRQTPLGQRQRPQLQGNQQQAGGDAPRFQQQRPQRQRPPMPERRQRPRQNQEQSQDIDF